VGEFRYQPLFDTGQDSTGYRLLSADFTGRERCGGRDFLVVDPRGLEELARAAFHDCSYFLRESHNEMVARVLSDPQASDNDRFVARTMLKNAVIAAHGQLPICQDTGTATVVGHKGQFVLTGGDDAEALSRGIYRVFQDEPLRYSQLAPLDMYREKNTGTNLPAQIDIYADAGDAYRFLFLAKGGGSANKSYLFQESRAILNPKALVEYLVGKMKTLGTAACPPYHLAFVIGGTSAEACVKTLKLASAKYYDGLPDSGDELGRAFRDRELEQRLLEEAWKIGIGAQFGGKYFAHDVRVIRLPRHGASLPIAMGVSCSADRNVKAKITDQGIFLEKLDTDPARWLPGDQSPVAQEAVAIDLNRPMPEILAELTKYPVKTRLSLSGTITVARDIAHARIKERLDRGEPMPDYFRNFPVYYAGPAKTPSGMASGSFGPTTAQRMDSYMDQFQAAGGALVTLAKGNRTRRVTEACQRHGGFYLGSIGGPAAILAQDNIRRVRVVDMEELGMEAVWQIDVEDFPAFIVVDDKGNDFFEQL